MVKPAEHAEQEEKVASGVVLPEAAEEKPQTTKIMAVGDPEEVSVGEGDLVAGRQDYLILRTPPPSSGSSKSSASEKSSK